MRQKLLLRKKKKQKSEKELKPAQKVALHAVQKQLQLLKLKEWLVVIGFVFGGAALRVPMQAVPSAEPITFFAILSGWLFGKKRGFLTGAAAGYLSNFFMFGGHGPWTIFQMLAWGIAGFLGGFIRNIKPKRNYLVYWVKSIISVLMIAVIATLVFEVVMDVSWVFFMPYSIFALFLSGLPFLFIHLVSNVLFASFLPFARKLIYEKGKFNEIELCRSVIDRINSKFEHNRMPIGEGTAEQ